MKKILMVVAALMVAICVNAQRIRIIDKDGQPVPYVSVMTADAKFIGVTDLDGVIADVKGADTIKNLHLPHLRIFSISDFQLLTLERRKSVIQEVMRSLDVRPRQLSRVTGMNYETIRNIAKKLP